MAVSHAASHGASHGAPRDAPHDAQASELKTKIGTQREEYAQFTATLLWELECFHRTKNAELHNALHEYAQACRCSAPPCTALHRPAPCPSLHRAPPRQAHEDFGLKSYDQWRNLALKLGGTGAAMPCTRHARAMHANADAHAHAMHMRRRHDDAHAQSAAERRCGGRVAGSAVVCRRPWLSVALHPRRAWRGWQRGGRRGGRRGRLQHVGAHHAALDRLRSW